MEHARAYLAQVYVNGKVRALGFLLVKGRGQTGLPPTQSELEAGAQRLIEALPWFVQ